MSGFARIRAVVLGAAAFPLVACAGLSTISQVDQRPLYDPGLVRTAAAGGLPTVVHGAPGDIATQGVRLPAFVGGGTLRPVPVTTEGNRLVLVLNSARAGNFEAICRGDVETSETSRGLNAIAVLCYNDRYYARGELSGRSISGPGSPDYADAVSQLLTAMMPPFNPEVDRDGPDDPFI